ncbi:pyrroline-5-carboxylate reductase [Pseudoroseomonas globiformis]|uniref:Pyrroline-5-carboxylate reductase n=1 Tax=Teichococcus globiformis TaxID=2307229 RepID=A0ABV7G2H6_9PROT
MTGAVLPPLLLIGSGKMGGAMMQGWLERGISEVVVVEPGEISLCKADGRIRHVRTLSEVPAEFHPVAIILAVKPQQAGEVLPYLSAYATAGVLLLSIMAGKTLSRMAAEVGVAQASLVRAMPNTPAAVRQGFTCAVASGSVDQTQRELSDELLSAVGDVAWVDDEALLDPVTAISGGGPAYVFLLVELLEKAGIEHGLPPELARRLARKTIIGSGSLLAATDLDAEILRRNVTSPKGTTERALQVLMAPDAWPSAVPQAIEAATSRSRQLGQS